MYSFNAWPVDEEWYGGWDRWVRDEMKSFCIGGDGESFCSHYDVEFRDFDEDDINDSVCGVYYHYFGTNEVEFHCVER